MKVFECSRCGSAINVQKSREIEEIKFGHCNKEFVIDKKTKRNALFMISFSIVIISFLIAALSQAIRIPFVVMLIPSLIIGFFAYRWMLLILAKLNKLSYTDK